MTKHPLIRTSSPAGILKCVESLKNAREEEQLTMVQEDALSGDGPNDKKHLIERLEKSNVSKSGKRARESGKVLHPDLVKAKKQDHTVSKKSLFKPVLLGTSFDHLGRSPSKPSHV